MQWADPVVGREKGAIDPVRLQDGGANEHAIHLDHVALKHQR